MTVTNYFYCNFPVDPTPHNENLPVGPDHDDQGMLWSVTDNSRFSDIALYGNGGVLLNAPELQTSVLPTDPQVAFIVRRQVFGATNTSLAAVNDDVQLYIDGATDSADPDGVYLDSPTAQNPNLIADSCNNSGVSYFTSTYSSSTYNSYTQKIVVIRVYPANEYSASNGFYNPNTLREQTELTHSYVVINGKIRL